MTKEQKEIITRLREEGQGYTTIARAAGLTKDCVKIWCQRHGLGGVAVKKAVPEEDHAVCRNCGKPLVQIPGRKPRKFCCDACRVSWWNSHPEAVTRKAVYSFLCPICGNEFTAYGNAGRKYCSRSCFGKARFQGADRHE